VEAVSHKDYFSTGGAKENFEAERGKKAKNVEGSITLSINLFGHG